MKIEIEWTGGVIRCGDDATFKGPELGTTFDFVCSLMRRGDEVYLYGAHGKFTRETYRSIFEALKAQGVKRITWEKLNTDKKRLFAVDT